MLFPPEFSIKAKAAVIGKILGAGKTLEEGKKQLPTTIGDGCRANGIADLLRTYILTALAAFAHEACELAREDVWGVDEVEEKVAHFLNEFVTRTIIEHDSESFRVPQMISRSSGLIVPELWDGFRASAEWRTYQDELRKVAELQAGNVPQPFSSKKIKSGAKDRERRLQQFIKDKVTKIAIIRRSAKVAKTNMQQWRHGDLPSTSVMSERIEKVLSGKLPLLP